MEVDKHKATDDGSSAQVGVIVKEEEGKGNENGAACAVDVETQKTAPINNSRCDDVKGGGRRVKRVVHCSDGVYEEYSSDEDGVYSLNSPLVDPKTMTWRPWIGHLSSKALAACDYVGESLADFLGITTPKYSYEIAEAERMKAEQDAEKKEADLEMAGWVVASPSASAANPLPASTTTVQMNTPVSILSQSSSSSVASTTK